MVCLMCTSRKSKGRRPKGGGFIYQANHKILQLCTPIGNVKKIKFESVFITMYSLDISPFSCDFITREVD